MSMEVGRNMMPVQPMVQPVQQIKPAEAVQQDGQQGNGKPGNDLSVSSSAANNVAVTYNGQPVQGPMIGNQSGEEASEEQIKQENEKVMKAISEMNKKMTSNTEAVFGIHEDTNRITIKLVDKTTKETIKELPPEKTLDMIAKVWELAGIMVDERK